MPKVSAPRLLFITSLFLHGIYGFTMPLIMEVLTQGETLFSLSEVNIVDIISYANLNTGFALALSPAYFLLGPIVGANSDSGNRKTFILYGIAAFIVSYSLFFIAINKQITILVLLSNLLFSVSLLTVPLVLTALAGACSGKERARYFSVYTLSIIAMVGCAQLGSYLVLTEVLTWFYHTTAILLAIVLYVLLLVVLIAFLPDLTSTSKHKEPITPLYLYQAIRATFFNSRVRSVILGLILFKFVVGLNLTYLPLYLRSVFSYSYSSIASFLIYACTYMLMGFFIYRYLLNYMRLHHMFFISLVIAGSGLIICGQANNIGFLWLGIVPIALGIAIGLPVLWSILAVVVKPRYLGFSLCLAWSGCAVAWMGSGIFAEMLAEINPLLPFRLSAVLVILCFIVYLIKFSMYPLLIKRGMICKKGRI